MSDESYYAGVGDAVAIVLDFKKYAGDVSLDAVAERIMNELAPPNGVNLVDEARRRIAEHVAERETDIADASIAPGASIRSKGHLFQRYDDGIFEGWQCLHCDERLTLSDLGSWTPTLAAVGEVLKAYLDCSRANKSI